MEEKLFSTSCIRRPENVKFTEIMKYIVPLEIDSVYEAFSPFDFSKP